MHLGSHFFLLKLSSIEILHGKNRQKAAKKNGEIYGTAIFYKADCIFFVIKTKNRSDLKFSAITFFYRFLNTTIIPKCFYKFICFGLFTSI